MISYGWGDYDQTYMVVSFKRNWTSKEFTQMANSTVADIKRRGETVNMIVDFRYSATPPMSILSYIRSAIKYRPQNLGRVVVVSNVKLWKRLYESIVHKRPASALDIHFVTSMDESYQLIVAVTSTS